MTDRAQERTPTWAAVVGHGVSYTKKISIVVSIGFESRVVVYCERDMNQLLCLLVAMVDRTTEDVVVVVVKQCDTYMFRAVRYKSKYIYHTHIKG